MREDLQQASLAELHFRALQGDAEARAEAERTEAEREVRVLELAMRSVRETPRRAADDASEAGSPAGRREERRSGVADRRSPVRPWRGGSRGRRREDELRHQLREARLALRNAQARLAEFEARRHSAG